MKNLVVVIMAIGILIPWPLMVGPALVPYLPEEIPREDAMQSAPLLAALIIYPVLFLLFGIAVKFMESLERAAGGQRPPAFGTHQIDVPRSEEEEESARRREKRRRQAQQEGALLITLAMLDDNKKK